MVVGLGTAGFFPVTEAFIADNFAPEERGRAYGIFGWAFMQGYLIGFSGGGWLVQQYGWQDTFIAIGAPQCLLALFFHLTVPSPPATKPVMTAERFFALHLNTGGYRSVKIKSIIR